MRGTVKFWNADKGFGFIVPEGGGVDVFCHIKNLARGEDELEVGQKVDFDEGVSSRNGKPEAKNVTVL